MTDVRIIIMIPILNINNSIFRMKLLPIYETSSIYLFLLTVKNNSEVSYESVK